MRKLVPFGPNEIGKTTQWLNDLAQDGLCVETWGNVFVKLKEGETGDWNYQIDIDDSTGDPNYQRKLELEKQGWNYVQTIGTTRHHIYRTRNRGAQLVWDEEYIEKYQKTWRTDMLLGIVAEIFLVTLYLWFTIFRNWEYLMLTLVESSVSSMIIVTVLVLYTVFIGIGEIIGTGRFKRRLAEGNQITEKNEDHYQRDIRMRPKLRYGLGKILMTLTTLVWFVLSLDIEAKGDNFDDCQPALACVDLRDIEADGFAITSYIWADNPGVNFGNRILEKSGLFAEYLYEVDQYGTDASGENVQIAGNYYKLRPDSIADVVLEQLIDRSTSYMYEHQWLEEDKKLPEDYWVITEPETAVFEKVIVAESDKENAPLMIFAQMEDVIVYLRYYGNLPAKTFVEELVRLYL